MRTTLVLVLTFISASVFAQNDINKLDWLTGTWTRTNPKPGRSGVEVWTKRNNELVGRGVNLKGPDTAFVEKLKIVARDGKLFYVADVPENNSEVLFEFTQLTNRSFVCENAKHDFPKKISYTLEGDNLKATISGEGREVDYLFVRKR